MDPQYPLPPPHLRGQSQAVSRGHPLQEARIQGGG